MANIDAAKGFKLVKKEGGGDWEIRTCYVPATDGTAIYLGDIVKLAAGADPKGKCPTVTRLAAVTDAPFGVVIGKVFKTASQDDSVLYRAASTETWLEVCTDKDAIYEAQIAGTFAITNTTYNADPTDPGTYTGDTATGFSALELGTPATTSSLMFQITGAVPRQGNAVGANTKVYCKFNEGQTFAGRTGV